MNAITQMVTQQLAGPAISQVAQRMGVSEATANSAVKLAVPLILAAMARNAQQPTAAQDLHQAINNDHDGSIFDNLSGYLSNPAAANGAGILGHVFGGQQPAIEKNLAQVTGVDPSTAGNMMEMLAPLVMGALGKTQQQQGLDASGLSNLLNNQQQQAQAAAPGMMGTLNSLLDQNNDGSALDDLSRIAGGFFK
jgi:hypothetical protein